MTLNTVELYGGAITTVLPDGFLDVSLLREVPDTQEVYVNSRDPAASVSNDGLGYNESIIFDLLQRIEVEDDRMALDFHLKEISELNGSSDWKILKYDNELHGVLSSTAAGAGAGAAGGVPQTCILLESVAKWGGVKEPPQILLSCVGLLRLKDVDTDVLLTVNVPLDPKRFPDEALTITNPQDSKVSIPARVSVAYQLLQEIVRKFNVRDKSLFV